MIRMKMRPHQNFRFSRMVAMTVAIIVFIGWIAIQASACHKAPIEPTLKSSEQSIAQTISSTTNQINLERYEAYISGPFDTLTKILILAPSERQFNEYQQFVEREMWRYHRLFDIYHDSPDGVNMKTINDRAGEAVECSEELIDLIAFGILCEEKSNGQVNIALGSVLKLWHEARTKSLASPEQAYIPDSQSLKEASNHTSIHEIIIDRAKGTVMLRDPLMRLDVGAIAKGYTVEKIAQSLIDKGLRAGAIDAGGNVRVIGQNEIKSKPWRVGIKNPVDDQENPYLKILDVKDRAVVTSGNNERYFSFKGERYSHIIDPKTLQPARFHDAVSVVIEDSGMADLMSTALMLMTENEGRDLLKSVSDCEVMWVRDGHISMTEGFSQLIATP